jgi:hypothetical protein
MKRYGIDWIAVGAGDHLDGWAPEEALTNAATLGDVDLLPFQTTLQETDSLKEALDAVVSSRTQIAPVFDGTRFLGMLTADEISREITQ